MIVLTFPANQSLMAGDVIDSINNLDLPPKGKETVRQSYYHGHYKIEVSPEKFVMHINPDVRYVQKGKKRSKKAAKPK